MDRRIFNIPNLLSAARFPLAAGFALADGTPARLAVLGVASATDLLDGWLARRLGVATRWGALLDPIADKTFVLVALTALLAQGQLSGRDYGVLLARDVATAVGAFVAWLMPGLDPWSFKARLSGKVVTVLQLAALLVLCVAPAASPLLVTVVGLASVAAIADYTIALARALPAHR